MNKFITSFVLSSAIVLGSVTPALADGAAGFRNVLLGAGAVFTAVQLNHNNHQRKMNQNLYNSGRMGTFWYNGKKVNCHNERTGRACYERDGNKWNYINNG